MSRYYFNMVLPERLIPDRYGHELPDLAAAQNEACSLAQQLLVCGEHWRKAEMSIMRDGQEVARVPFARLETLPLNALAGIVPPRTEALRC